MRGLTTWTKALAAAVAAAAAVAVQAAQGSGIRVGGSEARLHPFVDVEARYDTNVSYTPANLAVADLILHVRPGLELAAPGNAASVEFSGALDWAQYLGIDGDTKSLSNLYARAELAAAFNRRGTVSPRVDNLFARQISSTSLAAAYSAVISNSNTLTVSVPWKPGGGALVVAANAEWLVESFEKYQDVPAYALADLGYNQYRVGGELRWRFLPRTTGLLEGGYFARVPNVANRPDDGSGYDVLAGVTGLLSQRISATAKVGFGGASTPAVAVSPAGIPFPATSASSFLTDVAVEWLPADTVSLKAGYTRFLGLDPTAASYVADSVTGAVRVKLADRFALRAGARWDHLGFQAIPDATTSFLRVDPGLDASFGKWLSAGIGYVYSARTANSPTAPSYSKNEVFLKFGLTY
jgi:hypothetical protein